MSETTSKRRTEILQTLARELERHPGGRITTARLAAELSLSEAALYRHFPSKAAMFEGLIEFAEETVFALVARIAGESASTAQRCARIMAMTLTFMERNPGIARVVAGDALLGEHERLRARSSQFFERLETELRQLLRRADLGVADRGSAPPTQLAALLSSVLEGRVAQFVRSDFRRSPTHEWDALWALIQPSLFGGR